MNLYIFNESGSAAAFGIGTYIRELTAALHRSKINVCVIYLRANYPQILKEETDDGIKHWYFPAQISEHLTIEYQQQIDLYYSNIVYLLQLHIVDRSNLIFHMNVNLCSKLAEELKKKFDCRVVLTVHYFNWCFKLSGSLTRFRRLLETRQAEDEKNVKETFHKEKKAFQAVDRILCLSEHTRQILQADYSINPDKITVLRNGLTDSKPVVERLVLRQKYYLSDSPVILFAGRLDNLKGLTYALRAFKTVLNTHPHCRFLIAGNGAFDVFMQECEDIWAHVIWTGLISKAQLYALYIIADIGMMPSFTEQCSYVAIEMMMHGLPIIGSATAGLKEMIEDGETGLHIPVVEYDANVEIDTSVLAEKMLYLLQNPKERKRLGANARRRYETVYSTEIFRENMTRFYHSLSGHKK